MSTDPNTASPSAPAADASSEPVSDRGAAVEALRTAMAGEAEKPENTGEDAGTGEGGEGDELDQTDEGGEVDDAADLESDVTDAEPADETPGDDGMDAESLAGIAASLGFLDTPAKPAPAAPKADEPAPIPQDLADARKALADDLSEEGIKAVDAIIARLAKAEAREAAETKAKTDAQGSEYEKAVLGWFDTNAPAEVFGSAKTRTEAHGKMILAVHAGAIRIAEANAAQRKADPSIKAISGPQALKTSMQAYLLATGKGKKAKAPAAAPSVRTVQPRTHTPAPKDNTDPRSAGVAALKAALGRK